MRIDPFLTPGIPNLFEELDILKREEGSEKRNSSIEAQHNREEKEGDEWW
jgi:hypothetical protein